MSLDKKKFARIAFFLLFILTFYLAPGNRTAAAGNDSDLCKVVVHITIDNPEYFWRYPFQGQQLDSIRVAGVGKTINLTAPTEQADFEVAVPVGYHFRLYLDLLNAAGDRKYVYSSQDPVSAEHANFHIVLKAPDSQPPIINAPEWELQKQ